jgi:hypothetical protein
MASDATATMVKTGLRENWRVAYRKSFSRVSVHEAMGMFHLQGGKFGAGVIAQIWLPVSDWQRC